VGSEHRNTAKKINEHRFTARKINETPSPQHLLRYTQNNTFPQNKHITTLFHCAYVDTGDAFKSVFLLL